MEQEDFSDSDMTVQRLFKLVELIKIKLGRERFFEYLNNAGISQINTTANFLEFLKDGEVLCLLLGIEPPHVNQLSPMKKKMRVHYNFSLFQKGCVQIGMGAQPLFGINDILQPSAESATRVINGLTQIRVQIAEIEREKSLARNVTVVQYSKFVGNHGNSAQKELQGTGGQNRSPIQTRSKARKADKPLIRAANKNSSKVGLLEISSLSSEAKTFDEVPTTPPTPKSVSDGNSRSNRRISVNSINAQASVARVQERIASSYKLKCRTLEAGNRELLESVEDLQETISNVSRAKDEYKKEATRALRYNQALREKQLEAKALVSKAIKELQTKRQAGFLDSETLDSFVENTLNIANTLAPSESDQSIDKLCDKLNQLSFRADGTDENEKVIAEQALSVERSNAEQAKLKEEVSLMSKQLHCAIELRQKMQKHAVENLETLKFEFGDLSNDFRNAFQRFGSDMQDEIKELAKKVTKADLERKDFERRFLKEERRRKSLLNELHHLKGNIRVLCRIRPVLSKEKGAVVAIKQVGPELVSSTSESRGQKAYKEYEFDQVFGPDSEQLTVFSEVEPLVESVMDGYQSCIFAYGQTGSGKTFTMAGDGDSVKGINHYALEKLFELRTQRAGKYKFIVSNVEIYCEKIIDLLVENHGSKTPPYLDLREGREGVYLPNCTETQVECVDDVHRIMALGAKNRNVTHTNMNAASSRSHSIVIISVHGHNAESGRRTFGKLVLVDLAGSERLAKSGVKGQELKEAQAINKSLSCLGDVIAALESKASHVPFRNSKLTNLLKNSLGNDNKALMIVQVAPTDYNVQESVCSLLFASRVRKCELGKAKKREQTGELTRMRGQTQKLQDRTRILEDDIRSLREQVVSERKAKEEALKKLSKSEADAEKAINKATQKLQSDRRSDSDALKTKLRSSSHEIEALKHKLVERNDKYKAVQTRLESKLQDAELEIQNLKHKLKNATSASSSKISPVLQKVPRKKHSISPRQDHPIKTTGVVTESGSENHDLINRTPEIRMKSKKTVSFKNTPLLIPNSDRERPRKKVSRLLAPTVSSAHHSTGSKSSTRRTPARNKALGSASRVLQTPGRTGVRKPRRVLAGDSRRPKWNSSRGK